MLVLCQHQEPLEDLAFPFLPVEGSETSRRRKRSRPARSIWLQAHNRIFHGPDRNNPGFGSGIDIFTAIELSCHFHGNS